MRMCKRCKQVKPLDKFPKTGKYYREDGSTIDWRKWTCRKCLKGKYNKNL